MKKVSELQGADLDSVVARIEGVKGEKVLRHALIGNGRGHRQEWHEVQYPSYSYDWRHGGPIIERERINIVSTREGYWAASPHDKTYAGQQSGHTPLVAAMRCFVADKLGEEVEVKD